MVECLHRVPVEPGTTLLIEGGLPHAIGSGCFLVEIQEPTDYTIRVERTTPEGKSIADAMCHQGIGFDRIFDCFHYDGYTLEETLRRWRVPPTILEQGEGFRVTVLVGSKDTDKFRLQQLEIGRKMECRSDGIFSTLIVLSGSGRIIGPGGSTPIRQSNTLFLPAGLAEFTIESDPGQTLRIIRCFAPENK